MKQEGAENYQFRRLNLTKTAAEASEFTKTADTAALKAELEELAERKKAYKPFLTSSDARTALTYSNEIVKIDERLKVVKTEFERRTVAQPSGKAQAVKEAIKQSLTKEAKPAVAVTPKTATKLQGVRTEGFKAYESALKERLKEAEAALYKIESVVRLPLDEPQALTTTPAKSQISTDSPSSSTLCRLGRNSTTNGGKKSSGGAKSEFD